MLVELIIALTLGIIIGTITGLLPGIHINLVATFLLAASTFLLLFFPPIALVIFIVALSITHIFTDFIPTIFLGAPDEDTALSILPGHEMLLEGKGYEAVVLSLIGCLIGIILLLPLTFLFIKFLPVIYPYMNNIIWIVLLIILVLMLFFEKNKILPTLFILLLSGFLGIASLNLNLNEPLLPLLTGLFGSSSLIISITKKQTIQKQEVSQFSSILKSIRESSLLKSISASLIASPLCSFLPGLGSSQASTIGSYIIGELDRKEFLILVGIVDSLVMSLSFITLYSINKSRTGSAVAISKLLPKLSGADITLIILAIFISSILAFILSIIIAKHFSRLVTNISYTKVSVFILTFLTIIIIIFSGIIGLLIFITSTFLGISCILLNVRRTTLMACLIIPTLFIYML